MGHHIYSTDPWKHSAEVVDYVLMKTLISPHKSLYLPKVN